MDVLRRTQRLHAVALLALVGLTGPRELRADERPAGGLRTTVIHAPPPTSPDPCWSNSRPGTIDPAQYRATVASLVEAVRDAAVEAGSLELVRITIIPGSDRCRGRADLRRAYGNEVATWLASWAASGGRARIVRNYLTAALLDDVLGRPAAYGVAESASRDAISASVAMMFDVEWNGGDVPPASGAGLATEATRPLAVVVRAPPRPPSVASADPRGPAPGDAPPGPQDVATALADLRRQIADLQTASTAPLKRAAPNGRGEPLAASASVSGRAVIMAALGTSLLGVAGEYRRHVGRDATLGLRVGMLATDEEWAMGGRLRASSTVLAQLPFTLRRSIGAFEGRLGVAPGFLLAYAALRVDGELSIARRVWGDTVVVVGGGPGYLLSAYETEVWGWSAALSLEREIR